jgi:hypothetical protein
MAMKSILKSETCSEVIWEHYIRKGSKYSENATNSESIVIKSKLHWLVHVTLMS